MTHKKGQLHIFRSFVALAIALIIVLSAVPVVFAQESGTCGNGVNWSLANNHLTINGSGDMTNFTDDNMPPWYGHAESITRVTIGEGVTRVGSLAFYGCKNLAAVTLPSGLTTIGSRAFKNCTALPHVVLPLSLTTIGEAAFENCSKLNGIRLPDGLRVIRNYAFYRCSSLTTITVPAGLQSFGMVVFAYCENLIQAVIYCPLRTLPDGTFYGCEKLASVVLPETVSSTGEYAFHNCEQLTTIHYTGDAAEDLMDDIRSDSNSISGNGVITTAPFEGTGSTGGFTVNEQGNGVTSESTQVTESTGSIITKEQTTESNFKVNGEEATIEDINNAGEEDKVEIESVTTTTINATITGSEGWDELHKEIEQETSSTTKKDSVDVIVRVPESKVDGKDLAELAGKDVKVSIITPEHDVWEFNGKAINKEKVSEKAYDFGLTVSEVKAGKTKIDSDTVFKLKFARDVDFPVTVGVHVGHAYSMATLYEKNGSSYEELGTVIVDKSGTAWFHFDEIRKKTDYYVGINVAGKTEQDAVIPETLYSEYGLSDTIATLTDAEGNYYEVTGNKSSWGITAKQFGIYAGVAVALAVVIVTVVMVVMNKLKRNKDKYRAMALADAEAADEYDDDDDWEPIDEEALRLEIMRELLGEMDNK